MRRSIVILAAVGLLAACSDSGVSSSTTASAVPVTSGLSTASTSSAATTTLPPTTTTIPPTPELVVVGEAWYSKVDLAFTSDGRAVFAYALRTLVGDTRDSMVLAAVCADPHCATPPVVTPVWQEPGSAERDVEFGFLLAGYGPDGSLVVAFDTFTWDHDAPAETDMEALSQYVLVCGDALCAVPVLTEIGPLPDPEIGASPLNVYGVLVSEPDRVSLVYEAPSRNPFAWFNLLVAECSIDSGCVPDPTRDPVLYSAPPGDTGVGISGEAVLDANGAAMFAMGVQLPGAQWRILLARCGTAACSEPSINWLTVPTQPTQNRSIRDVDLAVDPAGNPILAYTDSVADHLDLYLAQCADVECSGVTTIEVAKKVRRDWDLAISSAGVPYLVWGDVDTDEALIATCPDSDCTTLTIVRTGLFGTEDWLPSLDIAPDGLPMISFHQPPAGLQLFNCLPETCGRLADG